MNWQKIKCKLGFHRWVTVRRFKVSIPVANSLTGNTYKVSGEAVFQECECCPVVRAYADTGSETQRFGVGLMAREAVRNNPHLINEPFFRNAINL